MIYSSEIIEEVRAANEIVALISSYLPLKQKGSSYFGLCPFHSEKSPSFSVSPERQIYHCFGCGSCGNVFTFIMQMENYNFGEAIRFLAERVNYTLPEYNSDVSNQKVQYRNKLIKIHVEAARFFYHNLSNSKFALEYLISRNITKSSIKKFGLGYAEGAKSLYKHLSSLGYSKSDLISSGLVMEDKSGKVFDRFFKRIMFPIFNIYGKIIGFGARTLTDAKPKYLNSPETPLFNKSSSLYNINLACKSKSKQLILTEGYMDVISVYQAGFENVCAVLGTAFGIKHARFVKNHFDSVILLFDSDDAGVKASLRTIPILDSVGLETKVLQIQNAKDPDEYIKKFGGNKFRKLIGNSVDSVRFQIDVAKRKYNLDDAADKVKFTKEAAQIISNLNDTIKKEIYISEISNTMQISSESIKFELDKHNLSIGSNNFDNPVIKPESVINKAKSDVINIIVKNPGVYTQLKQYLLPCELGNDIYAKLLQIVYSFCQTGFCINPAMLINYFELPIEQSSAAKILSEKICYDNLEKALSDIVKTIKKYNIEQKILGTHEMEKLKLLLGDKKAIDAIHIKL